MKPCASLSWALLALAASAVSAQPAGYGPMTGPGQYGAPGAPFEPMPAAPWGAKPGAPAGPGSLPAAPMAKVGPPGRPPRPAGVGMGQGAGPEEQAAATLREGMDTLLEFLRQGKSPNNLQVAAFLDREVAPYFDFEYMAQWVAGPAYEGMTSDEKKALAAQLEADFLATLARNLISYDGQQVKMMPPRRGPRGAVTVNVVILQEGTYPTRLEFRMSSSEDGWKVYDVVANGQSAASYYRLQFQRTARQQLGFVPR